MFRRSGGRSEGRPGPGQSPLSSMSRGRAWVGESSPPGQRGSSRGGAQDETPAGSPNVRHLVKRRASLTADMPQSGESPLAATKPGVFGRELVRRLSQASLSVGAASGGESGDRRHILQSRTSRHLLGSASGSPSSPSAALARKRTSERSLSALFASDSGSPGASGGRATAGLWKLAGKGISMQGQTVAALQAPLRAKTAMKRLKGLLDGDEPAPSGSDGEWLDIAKHAYEAMDEIDRERKEAHRVGELLRTECALCALTGGTSAPRSPRPSLPFDSFPVLFLQPTASGRRQTRCRRKW